jgi:hypothetical protein
MHSSGEYRETKVLKEQISGIQQIGIVCKLPAIKSEMVMSPYLPSTMKQLSPSLNAKMTDVLQMPRPDIAVRDRLMHRCHNSKFSEGCNL